jgi:hypothetical protein
METNKIIFSQARDFSEKLNDTFTFLRQNFRNLSLSLLFIAGPFTLIGGIFMGLHQSKLFSAFGREGMSRSNPMGQFEVMGMEYFLGVLFSWIALTVVAIIVAEYIRLYNEDKTDNYQWQDVLPKLKSGFLSIFLFGLGYAVIVMLASMLFLIPGIYMAGALSLLIYVKVYEEKGFFQAVSRCLDLIKGNWWATFGLLLVLGLIQGMASFIFQIPAFIASIMNLQGIGTETSDGNNIFLIAATVLSTAGTQLLYAITLVGLCFQYFNLVEEKDATGLLGRIDSIGTTPEVKTGNEESY